MAIAASNLLFSKPLLTTNSSLTLNNYLSNNKIITCSLHNQKPKQYKANTTSNSSITISSQNPITPQYDPNEPRKTADVLIEALEREGVTDVFAYPGGASIEIHQALTKSKTINTILPRHEQGGILASVGYARASDRPGVCITTSGPGATNLVTGLADAMTDSVPVIAITGQVPRKLIGTNAFQEVPITDIAKSITKHVYLVLDSNDIPWIANEAFIIATTGRPGPVLIDIPKDVQQEIIVPRWLDHSIPQGYISRLPKPPKIEAVHKIVEMIFEAKKPVLYIGGGCVNASEELRRFVELTGIPVASTLMGLGVFSPYDNNDNNCHEMSLGMLGMHGTTYANYAIDKSDLLLAFGVRFDDRVTGKIEAFASRAKIVHINIDARELGKNKQPHVSMHNDIKIALQVINYILAKRGETSKKDYFLEWRNELRKLKLNSHPTNNNVVYDDTIQSQYAIEVLDELTKGSAIITTGVGQHQIFVAHYYKFKSPRQWITSGGIGTMGYGLPAAMGVAVAKPGSLVIDVDGDGSMVVQEEDMFYEGNRAQSFLGNPRKEGYLFPDMVKFAEACDIPGERVSKKSELRQAIERMLKTPGPYLLDVGVAHQEHVLPMIPSGATFADTITEKVIRD
uniref:acetolactate synthase n=1 Tax=Chenopodium quinoa TaxID=63459 RepID=A0A803KWW3_CHEQI